jgi:hypothetical protein
MPIPLHARRFLGELGKSLTTTLVVDRLKPLLKTPAFVSRLRRLGVIAAGCAFMSFILCEALMGPVTEQILLKKYPEITAFGVCMQSLQEWRNSNTNYDEAFKHRKDLETYITGHFRDYITDAPLAKIFAIGEEVMTSEQYALAEDLIMRHPTPSKAQLEKATSEVKSFLGSKLTKRTDNMFNIRWFSPGGYFMIAAFINLLVIIPNVLAAFVFRGGLLMRLFGVAIVRENGSEASRIRILWRSIIGNCPFMLLLIPPFLGRPPFSSEFWEWTLGADIPVILLALMIWSAILPRSIQDRLARTYLVPR